MSRSDPLLMLADIARMEAERPELDVVLIAAIYHHLLAIDGRQPTLAEFRAYVDHVSCLGEEGLRQELGVVEIGRDGARGRPDHAAPTADATRGPGDAHRLGRPGWTVELFAARYQAAKELATPPYTYRSVAAHFVMLDGTVGADPDHLRKLVKRYRRIPG